jgi:hypothetical protein
MVGSPSKILKHLTRRMFMMLNKFQTVSTKTYRPCFTKVTLDPHALLLTLRSEPLIVTDCIHNKIGKFLVTVLEVDGNKAKQLIPNTLKQWGRLHISNGGDLIHAHSYHKLCPDGWDASFIWVRKLDSICRLNHYSLLLSMSFWLIGMQAKGTHQWSWS